MGRTQKVRRGQSSFPRMSSDEGRCLSEAKAEGFDSYETQALKKASQHLVTNHDAKVIRSRPQSHSFSQIVNREPLSKSGNLEPVSLSASKQKRLFGIYQN